MSFSEQPLPDAPLSQRKAKRVYGDDAYPVWYRRALPLHSPRARDTGFHPGTTLLKKGEVRRKGALPLSCDIILERDVVVPLRDGTHILADVFRPVGDGKHPAIVAWSPYGKNIGGCHLDDFPGRAGVPMGTTTELMKWEAADPGYWVAHGYVVLHPEARGSGHAEGDISYSGRQEAEDGYDFIEWAAEQPWSNGKLGMAGNSWLAITQWIIAAERPPHLVAIAPWEGASDLLREKMLRGGIPQITFSEALLQLLAGDHLVEDFTRMALEETDDTPYWQDKRARLERIEIPAYVVASYDNFLHTYGTFAGWRNIASRDKWLRVHNSHEWPDFYDPRYTEELRQFFDHYLNGADNGWQETPRIRVAMLDPGGPPEEVERVIASFPPVDYPHQALYLAGGGTLQRDPAPEPGSVRYAADEGSAVFEVKLEHDAEWLGYAKIKLWVEAEGSDDMDIVVQVEKRGPDGGPLTRLRVNSQSPLLIRQMLRVSRRALDPAAQDPAEPRLLLQGEQRLTAGEIVPVEIGFWPMGLKFRAGEILRVTIMPFTQMQWPIRFGSAAIDIPKTGFTFDPDSPPEMTTLGGVAAMIPKWVATQAVTAPSAKKGTHRVHFGGRYDSHLYVPLKYS